MASKKSNRNIRDASRTKAIELIAPNLLDAAEAVGQAAYEWEQAEQEAEQKAEKYRKAWAYALDNSWKAEQLDQLPTVNARPPRKRPTTKTTSSASKSDSSTATGNGQHPDTSDNGHTATDSESQPSDSSTL